MSAWFNFHELAQVIREKPMPLVNSALANTTLMQIGPTIRISGFLQDFTTLIFRDAKMN